VRDAIRLARGEVEIETRQAVKGRARINVYRVLLGDFALVEVDEDELACRLLEPFSTPAEVAAMKAATAARRPPESGARQARPRPPENAGTTARIRRSIRKNRFWTRETEKLKLLPCRRPPARGGLRSRSRCPPRSVSSCAA
jgi:translation initiation factor IF-1